MSQQLQYPNQPQYQQGGGTNNTPPNITLGLNTGPKRGGEAMTMSSGPLQNNTMGNPSAHQALFMMMLGSS